MIFDIVQENFAWMSDRNNKFEKKMIKTMKKGSTNNGYRSH